MTLRRKGLAVAAVQLLLVASVAAKYAWERHTCPMVWTRTTQFDPEQPLRGRYLALTLNVDACGLGRGQDVADWAANPAWRVNRVHAAQQWDVRPIAKNGVLSAVAADTRLPGVTQQAMLRQGRACSYATLSDRAEFFIAEGARSPLPLPAGTELWVLVTVPPEGPPRPVQLATSDGHTFKTLDLR